MNSIRELWERFRRILRLSAKCHRGNLNSARAVTLTYYTLFAIVPLAAMLFGITKGFQLEEKLRVGLIDRFPNQQMMMDKVFDFAANALEHTSGGIVAGIGIIVLLWSGFLLADNIEASFSSIWGLPRRRNLFHRFNSYFTVLFLLPILLIVLSSVSVVTHSALSHIDIRWGAPLIYGGSILSKGLSLTITCGIFFLIYFFMPDTRVRWKSALLAAILAGIAYQVMQDLFLIIQKQIFSYNQVYGSFAVLPLFLIWVQWAWQIVLYGAEIGFVSQNLHTGLFDLQKAAPASLKLQRIQQLTVAKIILNNVAQNRGATSWMEIERRLGLAEVEIDRIIDVLIDAGIIEKIKKNKGTHFLPRIPANSSLYDCSVRLRNAGRNAIPGEMKKECAGLVDALGKCDKAEKEIAEKQILSEL